MATDSKKTGSEASRRGKLKKGSEEKPARGINKLPSYLRNELGLHDWIASSVVIVGGGLALTLLVWVLSVVWPA